MYYNENEAGKEEGSPEGFKEPSKKKIRKNINTNNRLIKYDENTRDCIKNIIYDLKKNNVTPSLSTILRNVKCNDSLPKFSLMTLRRLLFDMGFYYEKNGTKSVLLEKNADQMVKATNNQVNRNSSNAYYVTNASDIINYDKKQIPPSIETHKYEYCNSNEKVTTLSPKVVAYSLHSMEQTYYTSHIDLRETPFMAYNSSHSFPQNLLLH
ncbi:hypothetical protein GWI33_010130 [Rhynchophorus ferrugineus]|uniref:Uncharacterized protein n=1 Tax=Rhynchophorus ferrugineus TaxID=354439 RepID=A0A834J216_RHYFE|nr:hypothetical protein GWI33_010130 [Rhynchophorus ferrugineus]